jgi:hypothetical protein
MSLREHQGLAVLTGRRRPRSEAPRQREAFTPWWRYARSTYLDLDRDDLPTTTTFYYDPVLDVHHRLSATAALTTSFYAAPQAPDDARRLFEAGCATAGYLGEMATPLRASRAPGSSLLLAREWGLHDLADRLAAAIETSYEPTWDRASGEFTWGMGLDEPHPRGQFNAFLAAADAGGLGRWAALSAAPLAPCPQVVDVDMPEVVLTRAEWQRGSLFLTLDPAHPDPGAWTEFRIVGVEPRLWWLVGIDGATMDVRSDSVVVRTPRVAGDLEFTPGSY